MIFACKHSVTATRLGKTRAVPNRLGLFLLEQATDGVDWIVRVLLQLLQLRSSGRCARAAELGFEQARGDTTDVRDKFWIRSCAVDLKRNGGSLAAAFATTNRA